MKKVFTLNFLLALLCASLGSLGQSASGGGKGNLSKAAAPKSSTQQPVYSLLCADTNSSVSNVRVCSNSYTWNGTTYTNDGTYSQKYTNVKGCDSTVYLELTLKMADPVLTINRNEISTTISYETYQWYKNDKAITWANQSTYTLVPPFPGYYSLVVNEQFCPDTAGYYVIQGEGVFVEGVVYKKNNADCIFNSDVDDTVGGAFKIRLDKNNIPQDTILGRSSTFGFRVDELDKTTEYSLQMLQAPAGYKVVCPSGVSQKFRPDTLSRDWLPVFGLDCDKNNPQSDLYAYLDAQLRFVNHSYLSLTAGNTSCNPKDATLTLELSPKYTFNTASVPPSSINGQTITWKWQDWEGSISEYIGVVLDPVGTLTPGDTACNTLSITPLEDDINPANNVSAACSEIRASMDPNDKKVSPSGAIVPGTELTYTINFENLGNDTAFNVYILDTLSNNLIYSSFELLFSSHPVKIRFNDVVAPRVAQFEFQDIYLADKSSPDHNKGRLIYKIKAKDQLPAGATIENTAHIFFDINPAIVTNTTLNSIGDGTSIEKTTAAKAAPQLYPNPVTDQLYINNPSAQLNQVMVLNMLGQTVYQREIKQGINIISTANLSPGIYYVKVTGTYETKPMKLIRK